MHKFRAQLTDGRWTTITLSELPMDCGCDGTILSWLSETIEQEVESYRYVPSQCQIGTVTLNLVQYEQRYGGPEEGGWYQTIAYPVRSFTVRAAYRARAIALLMKYCEAQNVGLNTVDGRHGLRVHRPGDVPLPSSNHYC